MPANAVPTISVADFGYLAPEVVLTAWGLLVLIADFALLRGATGLVRQKVLGMATLAGVVAALFASYYQTSVLDFLGVRYGTGESLIFFGTLASDLLTSNFNFIVICLLLL